MADIATPPVAPAPAPSPAPAPAPTPAAAPAPFTPSAAPTDTGPDPFLEADAPFMAAIAKVDGGVGGPGKPAAPKKPDSTPVKVAPPVPAKPGAAPKPDDKPRGPAPELRKQYETLKAEHEATKTKIPELEAKIADWERRGKDTDNLRTQLAATEKEKAELRAELFSFNRTRDPEWQQQYQKPFDDAADYAKSQIEILEWKNDDETTRQATWDDFADIYTSMPPAKAIPELRERFGRSSDIAVGHYLELTKLARNKNAAIADLNKNAAQRMKEHENRIASENERRTGLLGKVNKELQERVPEYHDDPTDSESTAARGKGYELFDADPKTPMEGVLKDAHVRHRFAAYVPLRLKVARLEAEIAKLKESKAVDPDDDPAGTMKPGGGGEGSGTDDRPWEQAARETLT